MQSPSREKHATPAGLVGLTAALHTGANAAFKGLRSLHLPTGSGPVARLTQKLLGKVPVGHNYETQSLAAGIRAGAQGQHMNPGLKTVMTTGLGPESAVMSELGEFVGRGLQGKTPHQIKSELKRLRKGVAMSPSIRETPLGAPVVGGVTEYLKGPTALEETLARAGLGATPASQKATLAQRLVPAAAGLGAVALEPHAALHFGINATRQAMARSAMGKRMMQEGFEKGLAGEPHSKLRQGFWDFVVSPAVLDTRRTGAGIRKAIDANEPGVRRLSGILGKLGGNPATQEKLLAMAQDPKMQAQLQAVLERPGVQAQLAAAVQNQQLRGDLSARFPGLGAAVKAHVEKPLP